MEVVEWMEQCYLEQQKPKSILSNLPNDLILNIIREADGGRYTHETKYKTCMDELNFMSDFFHNHPTMNPEYTKHENNYSFLAVLSDEEIKIDYYSDHIQWRGCLVDWAIYQLWGEGGPHHQASANFKPEWK